MNEENLPALPIPHCPVMIVLDTSHSMWGRGMQDQQDALKAFHKTLDALEFADSRIEISAVGMGGTQPIVDRTDKANNWKNRRVEFILIK